MRYQFGNQVLSSFFLWFDHTLLKCGEAFSNHCSSFYEGSGAYSGYHSFSSPFNQLVYDCSIPNATVMSGIYLGDTEYVRGERGFTGINFNKGKIYFTGETDTKGTSLASYVGSGTMSGCYAIKDFNVYLTSEPEEELLFETQYTLRNPTNASPAGLDLGKKTYPAVFIKSNGNSNEEVGFGGINRSNYQIRAIVISDTQFKIDAITSIFRDQTRKLIPIFTSGEMPFNNLGDFKCRPNINLTGGVSCCPGFHYDFIANQKLESATEGAGRKELNMFIKDVSCSQMGQIPYMKRDVSNRGVYSSIIDFEIIKDRIPNYPSGHTYIEDVGGRYTYEVQTSCPSVIPDTGVIGCYPCQ